jgi:fucose 4-O-acetylase-like acetyltransferase
MSLKKEKDLTVETLRGAVIILVVIGHVIGSGSDGGMQVADDSFLRYFYYTFIEFIQMPLFAAIAGWVYSLHPVDYEKIGEFVSKKFLRILIPMFIVGASYFILQYITPGTNRKGELSEIWKLLVFPYTLFWYLYSLFIVFLVIAFLDSFKIIQTYFNWTIVFLVSLLVLSLRDKVIPIQIPNFLSFKGAIFLLPCFIFGIGLNRFKADLQSNFYTYMFFILLIISIALQQMSWFRLIDYTLDRDTGIGLLIGLSGTGVLFRLQLKSKWFVWFGQFAYSIYLFHAFGTAGGRILIQKTGVQYIPIVFIVSLIFGLGLPIIADKVLERKKITRILFLGRG